MRLDDAQLKRLYDEIDFTEDEKIVSAEADEDTHDIEIEYVSKEYGEDYPVMYMASFPVDDDYACERYDWIINGDGKKTEALKESLDTTKTLTEAEGEKEDATDGDPRDYKKIVKWIKDEVETLKNNQDYVGGYYKLDDTFAIVMAWEEGFDPEDKDVIHDKEGSDYALCIGIRYINPHDTCDYWDFPVDKETGYLICESSSLPAEEKLTDEYLLAEAKGLLADYERAVEAEDLKNDEDHLADLEAEDKANGVESGKEEKVEEAKKEPEDLAKVKGTYTNALEKNIKQINDMAQDDSVSFEDMKKFVLDTIKSAHDTDAKRGFINNVNGINPNGGFSKEYRMVVSGKINLAGLCSNAMLRADKNTRLIGDKWANEKFEGLREAIDADEKYAELKELQYDYSDDAIDAVEDIIREVSERPEDEVSDIVWEVMDNKFIYYSDAFSYLQHSGVTDFEEPVREGYTGVCQIAAYYCEQEVFEILGKLGLN